MNDAQSCPQCGRVFFDGYRMCWNCGASVAARKHYCDECRPLIRRATWRRSKQVARDKGLVA